MNNLILKYKSLPPKVREHIRSAVWTFLSTTASFIGVALYQGATTDAIIKYVAEPAALFSFLNLVIRGGLKEGAQALSALVLSWIKPSGNV